MIGEAKFRIFQCSKPLGDLVQASSCMKNVLETTIDAVMQPGFSVSMAYDCSKCVDQAFFVLILL